MKQFFHHTPSRLAAALLCAALGSVCFAPAGHAGVVVHTPDEILAQQTVVSNGKTFFQDEEGTVWELVTDIHDAAISNPGAGGFYPADREIVMDAVRAIRYPIKNLDVHVYLLPFPRRGLLRSSATKNAIYVSPGVAPYPETQLHALIAHELGHVVHRAYLLDSDHNGWDAYRSLRGIEDEGVYYESAQAHKNRPHEVFAEDFRYLFGGDLANYSGGIENPDLALPNQVIGLERFLMNLAGTASTGYDVYTPAMLQLSPNPTFGSTAVLAKQAGIAASVTSDLYVYDVNGRRVASKPNLSGAALTWDGTLSDGNRATPGIYFVEVRQADKRWVGKLVIAQ